MKELFEKWIVEQFGEHMKKHLEYFDSEDGYSNADVNYMWLGFNAGVELADHL